VLTAAALLISLAALVVACASVYWTHLAPAQIELDYLRTPDELVIGGFEPQPNTHEVWLAFFVSNTGARGGFLEQVEVTEISVREGGMWTGPGSTAGPLPQRGAPPSHRLGAIALEAGDVRTFRTASPARASTTATASGGMTCAACSRSRAAARTRSARRSRREVSEMTNAELAADHAKQAEELLAEKPSQVKNPYAKGLVTRRSRSTTSEAEKQ